MTRSDIEKALEKLQHLGYVKVGYEIDAYDSYGEILAIELLMIKKSWPAEDWSHMKHYDEALSDLDTLQIFKNHITVIEAVPLKVYKEERTGGPNHKIIFGADL